MKYVPIAEQLQASMNVITVMIVMLHCAHNAYVPVKKIQMNEVERNKKLFLLLQHLIENKEWDYIELIRTLVENDTEAMKKTFQIMMSNYYPLI